MTDEVTGTSDLTAAPLLSVRDLRTEFVSRDEVVAAVDGVSLDLYAGRTLGIVGESGCGKSVTARSILGIVERPGRIASGRILLRPRGEDASAAAIDLAALEPEGREIRRVRGREIALVFQEPMTSFSNHYTIGNQISEMVRLHFGVTREQARLRVLEVLEQVGIPQPGRRIDEYPFQLSGGLRQRVMIAMALSCRPRILIADEPTTALDVTTQAQILALLAGLRETERMALMLITHDMGVIAETADEVIVMYLGRVVEQGPVDALFHDPKHPYTRALLRSIPSIRSTPRERLAVLEGAIPNPSARPSGCPFHTRCPQFMPGLCDTRVPELQPSGAQSVSCFLYHSPGPEPNVPAARSYAGTL